jgi:hypothetical protein
VQAVASRYADNAIPAPFPEEVRKKSNKNISNFLKDLDDGV